MKPLIAGALDSCDLPRRARGGRDTGSRPQTFTYDEAYDQSVGRSKQEITAAFGEPTFKRWIEAREVWQYDDLIYEQRASMLFAIAFDGDQVLNVQTVR